jgi:phosphate transport system permease protein
MFYPLVALFILSALGFYLGKTKSIKLSKSQKLASLPNYYGYLSLFYILIPSLLLWFILLTTQEFVLNKYIYSLLKEAIHTYEANELNLLFSKIQNIALGSSFGNETEFELFAASKVIHFKKIFILFTYFIILLSSILGFLVVNKKITPLFKSQRVVEKIVNRFIQLCSFIAILVTLGIFLSLVFETIQFFGYVNPLDFLLGLNWNPNKAFVIDNADQIDKAVLKDAFGIIPLMGGTLLIAFLAMFVAIPLGLMSAIYMAEYASKKVRDISKPVIEILAGIPTVVYGFFAALVVAPKIVDFGSFLGIEVSSESALAAGLTMGVMIIPFVSSLSDDVIGAVPQSLREGSYALGATKSETIIKVVLPSALPGIIGSFLLAISRAIGETMIVVMAASLQANLTINPLEPATTITTQIVTALTGDTEFDNPKTLVAFALGLTLFFATLFLNYFALRIVKKYREQYD